MRHFPIALALISTLAWATSCAPAPTAGPAPAATGFSVKGQPQNCETKPDVLCKVTGGGWICYTAIVDPKVTFGFNATSFSDGTATGEVEVVDHGTGDNFHGSDITSVTCREIQPGNDVEYTITGTLAPQSTGYPGTFTLIVRDNGEPGNSPKGTDTFNFTVTSGTSNGYNRSGILVGGNIQAHVF